MERPSAVHSNSAAEVQFQMSLLRLMYPDAASAPQVKELECLTALGPLPSSVS